MYPNYQSKTNQQPQYININSTNQPSYLNNNQQPSFLISTQNQNNRTVFSSMIQPQTSNQSASKTAGFSKLESMGRFIKQQPEPMIKVMEPTFQNNPNRNLNFRNQFAQKPKMSSSVIFAKGNDDEINRFPTFGNQGIGISRLQALMSNKNRVVQPSNEAFQESYEQRRKKEIESIKQQMNKLNKKMENFSFRKPQNSTAQSKPYIQLATRKSNPTNPQNSVQSNQGDPNINFFKTYSSGSTGSNYSGSKIQMGAETYKNQPQVQNQYLNPNSQQYKYAPIINHSLSANELNHTDFAKREENSCGMFKKKNAYLGNEPTENTPQTFHMSPRPHLKLAQKPPQLIIMAELKPAEFVGISSATKKSFKSNDFNIQTPTYLMNQSGSKGYGFKEFQKSDFAIGKKMGKGQFGQVMLVQHKATGFICGLKVMSKKQIREQKYQNQVARELAIQFYLSHRNVAPLYGYFSDEQNIYLLVEFCTNGQLLQLLRKAHRMQEADCSPIIREICEGLDYIHKEQIIHRDIKPENILFNFNTVKICDFGWAVYSGNGMRKTVAGSPLYYSPEVVLETKYDQKIDIWAIGMMTYQCLLGKIPFRIYSQLDLNRIVQDQIKFPEYIDVSDQAKDFILKICKKNPEERMEMREILRHPFITKYLKEKKVGNEVLEEFRKVLN